jgi:hypothetical protein
MMVLDDRVTGSVDGWWMMSSMRARVTTNDERVVKRLQRDSGGVAWARWVRAAGVLTVVAGCGWVWVGVVVVVVLFGR